MNRLPLIVTVRRNSMEDGPGIRTVVFFKGCPLRCIFCHNPETQNPSAEIAFFAEECIHCGRCLNVCPKEAIDLELPERIRRDRCSGCGECAETCPGHALRLVGTYFPVNDLVEILMRDASFYYHSGGGVTLSGGECTLYPGFLESLLIRLRSNQIHVTIETAGCFDYPVFRDRILPYVDLVYYDIKFADCKKHLKFTGKPNERILDNFRRLVREKGVELHPRIPIVPGVTSTRENLVEIVDFLYDSGARDVFLLPYNPMGFQMAARIGKPKPSLPEAFMNAREEQKVYELLKGVIRAYWRRK
jgi:pyruvate formate lyase activating enzyme